MKSMRRWTVALAALVSVLGTASSATAQPWDLGTDWSEVSNPMGQFTVGREFSGPFFEGFGTFAAGDYYGSGSNGAWVPTGGDITTIPGAFQSNGITGLDIPAGSLGTHTPGGGLGGEALVIRWEAPNTETVNVRANAWPAVPTDFGANEGLRYQTAELRHISGAMTTVEAADIVLAEYQGMNSGNPLQLQVPSLSVTAGDIIELALQRVETFPGVFMGFDLTVDQGAVSADPVEYRRSAGADFYKNFNFTSMPQNNPNGDWQYLNVGDTLGMPTVVAHDGSINTFGVGAGYADPGGVPSYARGGPLGFTQTALVGHGPQKVVWTAPADVDEGGVELTGFIEQAFEPLRQMQLRVYKNDFDGAGTPVASVNADCPGDTPGTMCMGGPITVDMSATQVAIQPGDTLTIIVDGAGPDGDGEATFAGWDLVINEIMMMNPFEHCDFDQSGACFTEDIDLLVLAVQSGSTDLQFDLNGDMMVTPDDITQWLVDAGALNLDTGNPYLAGDANLDGTTDGQDFVDWNSNKFTNGTTWTEGNFNGDTATDGSDFVIWNNNKFMTAGNPNLAPPAVPEPGSLWLLLLGLVTLVRRK